MFVIRGTFFCMEAVIAKAQLEVAASISECRKSVLSIIAALLHIVQYVKASSVLIILYKMLACAQ